MSCFEKEKKGNNTEIFVSSARVLRHFHNLEQRDRNGFSSSLVVHDIRGVQKKLLC